MVRTKQTGPAKGRALAKPKVNGATHSPEIQSPTTVKSPSQPVELSEHDRQQVKLWLDDSSKGFKITTAPLSKKRKRSGAMQAQTDLFEDRLSVQYEVKPRDKWECLRRYKKFTVGSESITTGQCILVKHDEGEEQGIDYSGQWKAKVLEVRALDSEHVYIRVAWLNRPEDLKTGRKEYHGRYELIPTNQMDIIDAMTVNGPCDVTHWDEADDESDILSEDQFFWRQTYDHVGTKTFSDLRKICVDDAPVNPDAMILQCPSEQCRKWLHIKCIAETTAREAGNASNGRLKKPAKKKPKQPDSITIRADSLAQAKAVVDGVTSEVIMKDELAGPGQTPADKSYIQITNVDGQTRTSDVQCLFCAAKID